MTQLVSVEEYLHTSFEYNAEYVEGKPVYRSLPKKPHSAMQGKLHLALHEEARSLGYKVWQSLRIRTKRDPVRSRIPDLCMTAGEPNEDILTSPPFLCVEILSPEDSALELRTKIDEYLTFGISLHLGRRPHIGNRGNLHPGSHLKNHRRPIHLGPNPRRPHPIRLTDNSPTNW